MRFKVNPAEAGTFSAQEAFAPAMYQQQANALAQSGYMPTAFGAVPISGGPVVFPDYAPGATNALSGGVPAPGTIPPPVGAPTNDYVATIDDNDPRRGSGVSEQVSPAAYSTAIGYELDGKQRPNKPQMAVINTLGMAAEQALGAGSRVVVYSGQEDPGHQHGSNRHGTGLAADVRVYGPDGQRIGVNTEAGRAFMRQAAALGARGIGAGTEYMGDSFHIDLVPHEQYTPGQGPVWGSAAKADANALLAAMGK